MARGGRGEGVSEVFFNKESKSVINKKNVGGGGLGVKGGGE